MKAAVSIPDTLFKAADIVANRLRISRSQLYARALERYLDQESDEEVARGLDAVYGSLDSHVDPDLAEAQRRAVAQAR